MFTRETMPVFIGEIVVRQQAAWRLHAPDSLANRLAGHRAHVRVRDSWILRVPQHEFGTLQHLDDASPMVCKRLVHGSRSHRGAESLVLRLCTRRLHPGARVQGAERTGANDGWRSRVIRAVPTQRLEIRELEIAPWFRALGEVIQIVSGRVLNELRTVRSHDAHLAVVGVRLAVLIHEAR